MNNLRDIFGYCIIPKNTILFRGHADASTNDCMFFTTKKWVAGVFNENIQIWKTATDIELYNNIFPTERNLNFDDIDIGFVKPPDR